MQRVHTTVVFALLLLSSLLIAQSDPTSREQNRPRDPFRIIENIYYVGASDIASYLITTPKGHFLIDGGFVETAPMILSNIKRLGFNPADVKYLLLSQAHFDHAGGLAELKQVTGAQMIVSKKDGEQLERGGKNDPYFRDTMLFPAVKVDHFLTDHEPLQLGNTKMTPILTPGHTKGCTTWTTTVAENDKKYDVVFLCGLTVLPDTKLENNPQYSSIASDFQKSFDLLKTLPCDVFLGAHGKYFNLDDKVAAMKTNSAKNPFVAPGELRNYVLEKETDFRNELKAKNSSKIN